MESSVALTHVEKFEASEMATYEARQLSERCRDYYDNKQLTDKEIKELQRRGQPPIVDNVIAGKINYLIGQEMNRRTDPKAYPRTPQHQEGAEAITDALRFVCDKEDWDEKRSGVWQDMLIEGYGGVEVVHKEVRGKIEVCVNRYHWDRLFYDPHSREDDFSDARYLGAVIWADRKEIERQYPDAKDGIEGAMHKSGAVGETYEDRPQYKVWGDKERDRVRVVMMYYMEDGTWKWSKFSYGVILEEGESPYKDEDGNSVCPLIMQSAYVDRDNNRYGEVAKLLDMQDEINKRRSKLLHLVTSRQTMGLKGAVNPNVVKRELAKPDGHIEVTSEMLEEAARVGMKPFEIIQTTDMASSQFALLAEAKESISDMGATEALMGASDGESGRAVLAKQQGAQTALSPLNDKLHRFTRRVYEAMWQRVRQFWTEERWIRVTDDERNIRFVSLNQPVTLRDQLAEYPQEVIAAYARQHGLGPNDPRLDTVMEVQNPIEGLDVDIIMEEVPDMVTLEAETFEQLVNIDASRGGALPLEMLIEASPLNSKMKTKILQGMEEQAQAQQQAGMNAEQIAQAKETAEIENTQADTALKAAKVNETQVETQRAALGY